VILRASETGKLEPAEASAVLRKHVAAQIGAIARPARVYIVTELPKTRSGKIMRRLLRDVAEGREIGDTTTLTDQNVLNLISAQVH
jgi:acetyl-CoA synthetase